MTDMSWAFVLMLFCTVYAYIPTPNNICSDSDFICNSDGFGTSIDRGSFSFLTGKCVSSEHLNHFAI